MSRVVFNVSKRSVFSGRRTRAAFDAAGQVESGEFAGYSYDVSGLATAKEARAAALAQIRYKREQGTLFGERCNLEPTDVGSWAFRLPSGSYYLFGAADLVSAFLRIEREYHDHDGVQAFCRAVRSAWTTLPAAEVSK